MQVFKTDKNFWFNLLGHVPFSIVPKTSKWKIRELTYKDACAFLLPLHYSGRKPAISIAFGWVFDGKVKAVCSFGKPASPTLCRGIMRGAYADKVYELNRLCRCDDLTAPLSQFVSACLRQLCSRNWIIVAYADSAMAHTGYIYQACNFIYTGITKERIDKYTEGNKHSRHYDKFNQNGKRKIRTAKHRYVYFATKNKKLRKAWSLQLAYPQENYPKTPNKNYILGQYLMPKVIETEGM